MIRILIADDHAMFLQGLKLILSAYPDFSIAGTAANGQEVLSAVRQNAPDVLVMDINMPVLNGYETALLLAKEAPALRIIALSMLADTASVQKMLEAGAYGYLFKNASAAELAEAIRTVAQHAWFVTRELQPVLAGFLKGEKDKQRGYTAYNAHPLSAREVEILKHIMEGNTNQEIADKLFLSNRTVDTHRKNILAKLGLKNTAALVKYAMEKSAFLGLDR